MPCANFPKCATKPRLSGPADLWILIIRRVDIDSLCTQDMKDLGHHKPVMLMAGLVVRCDHLPKISPNALKLAISMVVAIPLVKQEQKAHRTYRTDHVLIGLDIPAV